MASYRRFVSYIYRYKGGRKERNAGFVRVERRGELEKIGLWMKDGLQDAELGLECAFLFQREGQTVKIPAGEFLLTGGSGEFRYEGIELQKGFFLKDSCGVLLSGKEKADVVFAAMWEDEELITDQVASPESLHQEKAWQRTNDAPKMVWDVSQEVLTEDSHQSEVIQQFEDGFSEVSPEAYESFRNTEETCEETTAEMELEAPGQIWEEQKEHMPVFVKEPEDRMEESWRFLSRRYTKVNPLASELGAECLKIRPGDIGRLPRAYWIFSTNSFLLKGYCQFQHLMLARFPGRERPVYYLCVPGRYYGNDKFTAEMFGFDHFFPSNRGWREDSQVSHEGQLKSGTFGYWCAEVETEYDTGRALHERGFEAGEKGI